MSPVRQRSVILGLIVGAIVAVPASIVAIALRADTAADSVNLNEPEVSDLPNIPVTDLSGEQVTLAALGKDRVMVVNFWQRSCAPCRKEMPAFEQVHQEYGDDVRFVGVDGGDELKVVQDFIDDVGVTYDIVRDPAFDLATAMKVLVYPATFLVDRSGRIVSAKYGEMNVADLRSLIAEQLSAA